MTTVIINMVPMRLTSKAVQHIQIEAEVEIVRVAEGVKQALNIGAVVSTETELWLQRLEVLQTQNRCFQFD